MPKNEARSVWKILRGDVNKDPVRGDYNAVTQKLGLSTTYTNGAKAIEYIVDTLFPTLPV